MTLDQALGILFIFALLYRYHRSQLEKAEERFEQCNKERIQLHNFFYASHGASFSDASAQPEQPARPEVPATAEERYRAKIDRTKDELRRIARTRISGLGPALRRIEKRGRPRLEYIRPAMDPATAAQVKEKIGREFSQIEDEVKQNAFAHGRPIKSTG